MELNMMRINNQPHKKFNNNIKKKIRNKIKNNKLLFQRINLKKSKNNLKKILIINKLKKMNTKMILKMKIQLIKKNLKM